jgi:lipid-binding SYLF domain-containing protein
MLCFAKGLCRRETDRDRPQPSGHGAAFAEWRVSLKAFPAWLGLRQGHHVCPSVCRSAVTMPPRHRYSLAWESAQRGMPFRLRRTGENVAMTVFSRIGSATLQLARWRFGVIGLAALAVAGCQQGSGGEQTLVDRAALTLHEMMTQTVSQDPKTMMRRAKAVMICPQVFKAGFFVGGEGGSCVMLARSGNGTWSYPTFYDIGSGSFGFQFGVQDSQLILMIMTNRGLDAVMDSSVRLGANVSVAVASIGGGVQGATTAAVGADIVAFAEARGLFGGVSLDGGVMSARIDENQSYYGQPLAARQIVLQMQGQNPGADPLREVLTRYGSADSGGPGGAYSPPPGGAYQPPTGQQPYQPPYQAPPAQSANPPGYRAPSAAASQPYQPPSAQPSRPSAYPPPPTPNAGYAPSASPSAPQANSGYQPPPGQYTYPPSSGNGPVQEQNLPPPSR